MARSHASVCARNSGSDPPLTGDHPGEPEGGRTGLLHLRYTWPDLTFCEVSYLRTQLVVPVVREVTIHDEPFSAVCFRLAALRGANRGSGPVPGVADSNHVSASPIVQDRSVALAESLSLAITARPCKGR